MSIFILNVSFGLFRFVFVFAFILFYLSFFFSGYEFVNPKIVDMFWFAGDKHSTPNCPIELKPDFNPSSGSQSYTHSDPMCLKPAHYNIPFFTSKAGPKSAEWNTGAHETRPGHHLQVLNEQIPLPFIVKCRNMK